MPTSELAPGSIVKLPFPYTDLKTRQNRPALVVAMVDSAGGPALLWVLMITSAGNRAWAGDVPITDLKLAGLPVSSVIRTAKIATVEAARATRLGTLADADWRKVKAICLDRLGD